MPTYDYRCRECDDTFEVVQSFSDDALTTCEKCGGELRKIYSAAGIIFKGDGWHIKDYAAKGAAPSGNGSSDGGSSDTDGAPKSDGKKSDAKKSDGKTSESKKSESKKSDTATSSSSGSKGD